MKPSQQLTGSREKYQSICAFYSIFSLKEKLTIGKMVYWLCLIFGETYVTSSAVATATSRADLRPTCQPDYDSAVLKEGRLCCLGLWWSEVRRIWDLSSPLSVSSKASLEQGPFPIIPQSARPLLCTLRDVNISPLSSSSSLYLTLFVQPAPPPLLAQLCSLGGFALS